MKIKNLQFIYGLLISLQQLLFLANNGTFGYLFFVGIIAVLYFILAIQKKRLFYISSNKTFLGFLFGTYIFLIILSVTYFLENDVFRWFVGLTPFVLTIPFLNLSYTSNQDSIESNIRNLWAGIAWGGVIVLLITFIFGVIEEDRLSYGGISASTVGRNSVIIITYGFSQFYENHKNRRIISYLLIMLGIIALLLSSSKSSILAIIGIFLFLIYKLKLINIRFLIITSMSLVAITFTPYFDTFMKSISYYQDASHLETLSGRTYIWESIVPLIEERFWLGYGYNSPSLLLTTKYFDIWDGRDIIQAHSAWYQSMLNLGIVGTITLIVLIVAFYNRVRKIFYSNKSIYIILFSLFTFLVIRGFSEASFANGYSVDVFLFSILVYQLNILTKSFNKQKKTSSNAK